MNYVIIKDKLKIEDLIYNISGKQVMSNSKISVTKCHNHLYDIIVTHYDIGKATSVFNNFIMGGKIIWN